VFAASAWQEAKAKREAETKAKAEAEAKAKREAEAKARREAEERAKREAEAEAKAAEERRQQQATALGLLQPLTAVNAADDATLTKAVAFCDKEGATSVSDIVEFDMLEDFLRSLGLKQIPTKKLRGLLQPTHPMQHAQALYVKYVKYAPHALFALFALALALFWR
jgi:membrane protein involved in colicin uptake